MSLIIKKNKGDYVVSFKKSSSIFSTQFLFAFSVALLIHILALFLFRIDLGMLLKIYGEPISLSVSAPLEEGLIATAGSIDETINSAFPLQISRRESPDLFLQEEPPRPFPKYISIMPFDEEEEALTYSAYLKFFPSRDGAEKIPFSAKEKGRIKIAYIADTKKKELIWLDFLERSQDSFLDKQVEKYLMEKPFFYESDQNFVNGVAIVEFRK